MNTASLVLGKRYSIILLRNQEAKEKKIDNKGTKDQISSMVESSCGLVFPKRIKLNKLYMIAFIGYIIGFRINLG